MQVVDPFLLFFQHSIHVLEAICRPGLDQPFALGNNIPTPLLRADGHWAI